jgi:hypothetical protein
MISIIKNMFNGAERKLSCSRGKEREGTNVKEVN